MSGPPSPSCSYTVVRVPKVETDPIDRSTWNAAAAQPTRNATVAQPTWNTKTEDDIDREFDKAFEKLMATSTSQRRSSKSAFVQQLPTARATTVTPAATAWPGINASTTYSYASDEIHPRSMLPPPLPPPPPTSFHAKRSIHRVQSEYPQAEADEYSNHNDYGYAERDEYSNHNDYGYPSMNEVERDEYTQYLTRRHQRPYFASEQYDETRYHTTYPERSYYTGPISSHPNLVHETESQHTSLPGPSRHSQPTSHYHPRPSTEYQGRDRLESVYQVEHDNPFAHHNVYPDRHQQGYQDAYYDDEHQTQFDRYYSDRSAVPAHDDGLPNRLPSSGVKYDFEHTDPSGSVRQPRPRPEPDLDPNPDPTFGDAVGGVSDQQESSKVITSQNISPSRPPPIVTVSSLAPVSTKTTPPPPPPLRRPKRQTIKKESRSYGALLMKSETKSCSVSPIPFVPQPSALCPAAVSSSSSPPTLSSSTSVAPLPSFGPLLDDTPPSYPETHTLFIHQPRKFAWLVSSSSSSEPCSTWFQWTCNTNTPTISSPTTHHSFPSSWKTLERIQFLSRRANQFHLSLPHCSQQMLLKRKRLWKRKPKPILNLKHLWIQRLTTTTPTTRSRSSTTKRLPFLQRNLNLYKAFGGLE